MKIEPECIPCLVERGYKEASRAAKNKEQLIQIMVKVLEVLGKNISSQVAPAYLGTLRDRIIKQMLGEDPYKELKKVSNKLALEILPFMEKFAFENFSKDEYECFRRVCMVSVAANSMEFDVLGYEFKPENLKEALQNLELTVDNLSETYRHLKNSKKALILTDNAGEIVFDGLLAECLRNMGLKVTMAVKAEPILNDATMEDALMVGVDKKVDELTTIGTDSVGLLWEEASEEIKKKFMDSDLVIAKGMG
ncbi:hypothetical protein DRO26_02775, partial [Candidatus Bathyarchaeota archaeon]